jgi:hypothetical protein
VSTYAILKAVGDGTFFVRLVGTRALIFDVACRRELKTLEHIAEVPGGHEGGRPASPRGDAHHDEPGRAAQPDDGSAPRAVSRRRPADADRGAERRASGRADAVRCAPWSARLDCCWARC